MEYESTLIIAAICVGFYMAWNIGANDVANAIGTSVGSGSLSLKRAVILAGIFEFSGALFVGASVSQTIQKGIINTEIFAGDPHALIYGMMASLLSAGIWLQVASYYGWPVSTTHTIVGAVLGFGAMYGGLQAVYWGTVASIVGSWVISPLLGAASSYLFFTFISRKIFYNAHPVKAAIRLTPFLVFWVSGILTMVTLFKGLKNLHLDLSNASAMAISIGVSLFCALVGYLVVRRYDVETSPELEDNRQNPQVIFALQKAQKHLLRAQGDATGEVYIHLGGMIDEVSHTAANLKKQTLSHQNSSEFVIVEKIFACLQVLSASCMAFAHGANDVANAIGPLSAIIVTIKTGVVNTSSEVPFWVLLLGATGIVIGLASWGWRVVDTIGKRITELTPSRGFAAEFGAATTILIASKMGLPVSTTHTLVGAVLGVGLARGIGALNLNTIRDIFVSWIVTVPIGAVLAIIFFSVLNGFFG
ncbi:MAG: PiT family inorganic phosphate transporter [Chlamydiales bacterium]|jgi:PiT family inorganic phosphate transporter